jgi:quercetin dioxygenase-like cupin family protein|tara:strand:+ start:1186 stop:1611 length:426 start_codon:yes stop_codon:yes gene_type:complete
MKRKSDSDVKNVLKDDGLPKDALETFHIYENRTTVGIDQLREELGMGSWAVRIAYNDRFGGVIIQQQSGEGNRKHYHPDADENWLIIDGEWEWWIENLGSRIVKKNDIIVVPKNTWHKITCKKGPGIRYAITQPDVEHIYE